MLRTRKPVRHSKRQAERGSALVYILIAIALLGALTVTFMEPSSQQTSSQSGFRTGTAVKSQIDVIRSAVQECVLRYPNGDLTIDNAPAGDEPGARREYPISPDSDHYPAAYATAIPAGEEDAVRHIRCPGNNPGGANVNEHELIFGGNTGKFMPAPPDLFQDWQWYNGADGVFFWIATDKADSFLQSSLEKMDENFSECESDIIIAPSGSPVDLDSAGTINCPGGNMCYRVWMIINSGAEYQGADEIAAGCGT